MFSFLKANVESVCVFLFLSLKCCVWNLYLIWINLCCFFFLISGWMFATCTSQVKPEDRQASMGLFPFSQQKKISQRQSGQIASETKNYQYFFSPLDTNILGRFVDDSDATVFNMTKWVNVRIHNWYKAESILLATQRKRHNEHKNHQTQQRVSKPESKI